MATNLPQPSLAAPRGEPGKVSSFDIPSLTARMIAGEESAYRTFYDEYYERLRRYLLVVTAGDEDTTREALQSALIRVVKHIKPFQDESVFWSWLTVLARTALADQSKKRARYWNFLERFKLHTRLHSPSGSADESSSSLADNLEQNLAALPADERQLLESKYFEGRPVREIAATLQTSEKAIESRLVRIRRKLKESLETALKHE